MDANFEAGFAVIAGKGYIVFSDRSDSGELHTKESALEYLLASKEEGKIKTSQEYFRVREEILNSELPSVKAASNESSSSPLANPA